MHVHSDQFNLFTIFRTHIEKMSLLAERDKTQTIPDPAVTGHVHGVLCKNRES